MSALTTCSICWPKLILDLGGLCILSSRIFLIGVFNSIDVLVSMSDMESGMSTSMVHELM